MKGRDIIPYVTGRKVACFCCEKFRRFASAPLRGPFAGVEPGVQPHGECWSVAGPGIHVGDHSRRSLKCNEMLGDTQLPRLSQLSWHLLLSGYLRDEI
jgi:hypothetical protein